MTRLKRLPLSLLITAVLCWSSTAMAQFGGSQPGSSPTYSPYLNLLRGGNSGVGQNYFGLVRPQQEFAQQNQALGQGLQTLQMQSMQGGNQPFQGGYGYSQLGATGHPVIFNSFGTSRFSGGYTGVGGGQLGGGGGFSGGGSFGGGGGFGGGQFGGGGGGFSGGQFGGGGFGGGQSNFGGVGSTGGGFGGFNSGGVSGHLPQFGGIGNTYQPGR